MRDACRQLVSIGSTFVLFVVGTGVLPAADWKPERAVEIVTMSGPGGANDIIARTGPARDPAKKAG